jgi:hypothetical protein
MPRIINTAEVRKISGQSLYGRKLILNPVKNETKASAMSAAAELT